MLEKCDFKMEPGTGLITAPSSREVLPGRMIRALVTNLERNYDLYEYSLVKGYKAADELEDRVMMVPLTGGFRGKFPWLTGGPSIVVFQKLHPSFYDENCIQLSPEEEEDYRSAHKVGDEFVAADYNISMPSSLYIAVVEDTKMLERVMNHIKPKNFDAVREAVTRLASANISIFDEAEMLIEYEDAAIVPLLEENMQEWLNPVEHVEKLDI